MSGKIIEAIVAINRSGMIVTMPPQFYRDFVAGNVAIVDAAMAGPIAAADAARCEVVTPLRCGRERESSADILLRVSRHAGRDRRIFVVASNAALYREMLDYCGVIHCAHVDISSDAEVGDITATFPRQLPGDLRFDMVASGLTRNLQSTATYRNRLPQPFWLTVKSSN